MGTDVRHKRYNANHIRNERWRFLQEICVLDFDNQCYIELKDLMRKTTGRNVVITCENISLWLKMKEKALFLLRLYHKICNDKGFLRIVLLLPSMHKANYGFGMLKNAFLSAEHINLVYRQYWYKLVTCLKCFVSKLLFFIIQIQYLLKRGWVKQGKNVLKTTIIIYIMNLARLNIDSKITRKINNCVAAIYKFH